MTRIELLADIAIAAKHAVMRPAAFAEIIVQCNSVSCTSYFPNVPLVASDENNEAAIDAERAIVKMPAPSLTVS